MSKKTILSDKLEALETRINLLNRRKEDPQLVKEYIENVVDSWNDFAQSMNICWEEICRQMEQWRHCPTMKTPEEEKVVDTFFEKYENGEYSCGKDMQLIQL